MAHNRPPLVFEIGLPYSGGTVVQTVFEANGYRWFHHQSGQLAADIAYAKAAGTRPLSHRMKATGFSGLHSAATLHEPPLTAADLYRYLHSQFPQAYFVNTTRDAVDWAAARFFAQDGQHRAAAAWHRNADVAELPALWFDDLARHTLGCAKYFATNPRYLAFDVSADPIETLCSHFVDHFDLAVPEFLPDFSISPSAGHAMVKHLEATPFQAPHAEPDTGFVDRVADHCAARKGPNGNPRALSRVAVHWSLSGVTDRDANPVQLAQQDNAGAFLLGHRDRKLDRAQSTLSELSQHGAKPPLWIDMMDARVMGSEGRRAPPPRTVAYNRRPGSVNVSLWPLPGYHSLAPVGHVAGPAVDPYPFDAKEDRCAWLGNITGRMVADLAPKGRELRGVYALRDQMDGLSEESPDWADIRADLMAISRYNIVQTYRDHPDFKVGLVLRGNWQNLRHSPAFKGLCDAKQGEDWCHRYRYVLSLAGNDTGSNFLSAAASNSVILKEEDGWELFYTAEFKPWEHYIPLELGAQDVEEKLAWARAHPEKCKAIAKAASDTYAAFARPANRTAYLRAIAERLNTSPS